jgi:dUTP pyrophosphatase
MQLWNSVGVIDADYSQSDNEGHIWVKFYNDSPDGKTITIKRGEAMCQGVIQQYFKTVNDETDGIRNGGWGSTDKRG